MITNGFNNDEDRADHWLQHRGDHCVLCSHPQPTQPASFACHHGMICLCSCISCKTFFCLPSCSHAHLCAYATLVSTSHVSATVLDGMSMQSWTWYSSTLRCLTKEKSKVSRICYRRKRLKDNKIMRVQRTKKFSLGVKVESMAEVAFKFGLECWIGFRIKEMEEKRIF